MVNTLRHTPSREGVSSLFMVKMLVKTLTLSPTPRAGPGGPGVVAVPIREAGGRLSAPADARGRRHGLPGLSHTMS